MVLRGWRAGCAVVLGVVVIAGVVVAFDVVPGLSVESLAGLFPGWAVSAKVSHTIVSLTAKIKTGEVRGIVATLDRFAASHGFVRDADVAVGVGAGDPDRLRISYTGAGGASLSFYAESGAAFLAVESEPGREGDLSGLGGDVKAVFGPLGFRDARQR